MGKSIQSEFWPASYILLLLMEEIPFPTTCFFQKKHVYIMGDIYHIYIYQMVQTPEFWTINYVWLDTLAIPSAASHTNYDIRPRPVRPNKKVRLPDLDPSCCHVAFCTKIPGSRSDALAAFWSFGWRCVFQENQQMGGLGTGLVELEQKG